MRSLRGTALRIGSLILVFSISFLSFNGCVKNEPSYERVPIRVYLKRLDSDQEKTVARAVDAIAAMGAPAVPYIIRDWRKADVSRRVLLAQILEKIGPAALEAVPMLIESLDGVNEDLIGASAAALGAIGQPAVTAAPKMASLLRSTGYSTQIGLLKGLGGIGPEASDAIPLMLEAAEREKTRATAIAALSKMGPKVVDALRKWLTDGTNEQKMIALDIVSQSSEEAAAALPYIIPVLKDKNPRVRVAAVRATGKAGPQAATAIDDLINVLKDRNKDVRDEVVQTIVAIGMDATSEKMIAAVTSSNPRVREGAVRVISRWASVRDDARSILIQRLGDSDVTVQAAAIDALTSMGARIVPTMIRLLDSRNVQKRFAAARVLGNLGSDAESAIPALRKASRDKDSLVREEANKALRKIQ